jgi:Ca2+-binding RTX toxin-like protein
MAVIIGGPGPDGIFGDLGGAPEDDIIFGNGGDDRISGLGGNDMIFGGMGQDLLFGDGGDDTIEGGMDPDRMDGGAGKDTLSYAQSPGGVLVDLIAGAGAGADAAGDQFVGFENIWGSGFADQLLGSNGANEINGGDGDDFIDARGGKDRLIGGLGADTLVGGPGKDRFIYREVAESPNVAGSRDVIIDFIQGDDRIDLKTIDANALTAANDAFTFVAAFTATPGELIAVAFGMDTIVLGDVDGDAVGDIGIIVLGMVPFVAADFIL